MTPQTGFRHIAPEFRTYAGSRALSGLGSELRRASGERVVLIGSPSVVRYPEPLHRLREVLEDRLVGEFWSVQEHSPEPIVRSAAELLADREADTVIAVGGGSAVVTSRAAVILLAEKRPARDLATYRGADGKMVSPRLDAPKLPIWVVPTTPTTAYAKAGSAVRDPATGERLALYDPKTRARGVVFDPGFAATAPAALVQSAALNALSLAVEGLHVEGADPLADSSLAHALRLSVQGIPRISGAPDGRVELMAAALLSGQGSDFARGGVAQALSHTLGPLSTVANGVVESMLLPATTRLDAELSGAMAYPAIASAIGSEEQPEAVAGALRAFLDLVGVPRRLRDIGIERDALPSVAEHGADDWFVAGRPSPPGRGTLLDLLRRSW